MQKIKTMFQTTNQMCIYIYILGQSTICTTIFSGMSGMSLHELKLDHRVDSHHTAFSNISVKTGYTVVSNTVSQTSDALLKQPQQKIEL